MQLLRQQKKPDVLILLFIQKFAPVEFGGEGQAIPSGLMCSDCAGVTGGVLWRHGWYERFFICDLGQKKRIRILRLRCSKCRASHACLYDFMVPYRQYGAELLGLLAWKYLIEKVMTYEEFEWGLPTAEADEKGHRHLVFEVIERLCQVYSWLMGQVEKANLRPGESLWKRPEPMPERDCVNGWKAKKAGKEEALNQVARALTKFRRLCCDEDFVIDGSGVFGILQRAGLNLPLPFSLLTAAKGLRLYAPQSLECKLM